MRDYSTVQNIDKKMGTVSRFLKDFKKFIATWGKKRCSLMKYLQTKTYLIEIFDFVSGIWVNLVCSQQGG